MELEHAGGEREEERDERDGHRQRARKGGRAIPR